MLNTGGMKVLVRALTLETPQDPGALQDQPLLIEQLDVIRIMPQSQINGGEGFFRLFISHIER